ncbi:tetratricopeptide repeat protein [Streptomyces sp. NBC_01077]|uniref:hypothetical protein n=1 Tax=Streptomyces sp. NBC_01077 TaxID=2903746 RepID=UPI00386D8F75|nr:tetratricopeptide repeat protein [Streptomyces sp. NBC_01077]
MSLDQLAAAERGYACGGPAERLLWERLSVFEGTFGRDAVVEVCASGKLPPAAIPAVLDRLVPLALLPVDDLFAGEDDVTRYWMPHAMRAVGARRLTERGDRRSVVLRHRRWCVKLARRAADWWQSGRQLDARDLALRELPDLAAAMDPTTAPLSPGNEADKAVEIAVSLWFLWVACGRATEGRTRLRHALALLNGEPTARALWLAAFLDLEAGRPEDADPLLGRAWAAAVRDGDEGTLGLLAHLRGSTALYQGRTRAAAHEFREALALNGGVPGVRADPARLLGGPRALPLPHGPGGRAGGAGPWRPGPREPVALGGPRHVRRGLVVHGTRRTRGVGRGPGPRRRTRPVGAVRAPADGHGGGCGRRGGTPGPDPGVGRKA